MGVVVKKNDKSGGKLWSCVNLGIDEKHITKYMIHRIGDEYQVEVPTLMTKSNYLAAKTNEHESQAVLESVEFRPEVKTMEHLIRCNGIKMRSKELDLARETMTKLIQTDGREMGCGVPDGLGDVWTELDKSSFLLGLYIFGKNLDLVKEFVGSRKMGDILKFYYSEFCKSVKHRRWSKCLKVKSRTCVYGDRMFKGARQTELLSRLYRLVSDQCKTTLEQVSSAFGEGRMELDEYVFTLKATVGLHALVEVVGIGKGKDDLTGMVSKNNATSNQVVVTGGGSEVLFGKECSRLTQLEIVNFLTGDYMLSKSRSNELFWEAVWPRLLARGWHSEQPENYSFAPSQKRSVVFLVPGVNKFSRRSLVKGSQYFDCVCDVLTKVASDPGLLDLDVLPPDHSNDKKEENERTDEMELENDGDCPQTPTRDVDDAMFTIVDTSLSSSNGIMSGGVREFRSIPFDLNAAVSGTHSEDKESTPEYESTDVLSSESSDSRKKNTKRKLDDEVSSDKTSPIEKRGRKTVETKVNTSVCSEVVEIEEEVVPGDDEIHKRQPWFDLNEVPDDMEVEGVFITPEENNDVGNKQPENPNMVKTCNDVPMENGRRQSKRNRPLTTKVLEAFACGYLTVKEKRKSKDGADDDNLNSRQPSRRPRGRPIISDSFRQYFTEVVEDEDEDEDEEEENGNDGMVKLSKC